MNRSRRLALAVGVAGGAIAGGAIAIRRARGRPGGSPDAHFDDDFSELAGATHRGVATSDGGEIHVVDRGQGRPLVLLHGVTLTTQSWHYQLIDLVEAGYRVLALDVRGHGRSQPGGDGYTVARLAEDVYEVLRALDVVDAIVIGHSLGGMTALELLADHSELGSDGTVSGIVLVSTSASPVIGNGVPAVLARVSRGITPAAGRGHAFASTRRPKTSQRRTADLASAYCRLAFGAQPSPTHIELVRAMTSAVPPEVLSPLILTLLGLDVRKLLAQLRVPALVIVGQRDLVTPVWHSRYLASHIPDAELVVLARCGHLVPFERRNELAHLIVSWVERQAEGRHDSVTDGAPRAGLVSVVGAPRTHADGPSAT